MCADLTAGRKKLADYGLQLQIDFKCSHNNHDINAPGPEGPGGAKSRADHAFRAISLHGVTDST